MKIFGTWLVLMISFQALGYDLRESAMGDTCYFIRKKTSVSICHPANIAREDKQFFFGNFLFSEGFGQAESWRKVIDGDATASQIISLVEDDSQNYIANETELGFVGDSWAVTFKPYEFWVESRIQNPSYPYARFDIGVAQVLGLDFGHFINDELSVGVKVEAAKLQTLKRSFFVPDLAVDSDLVNLEPDHSTQIVASPGIAFEPADAWGAARYSVLWQQSYINSAGILYTGVSFENEFSLGKLEWGLGTKFQKSVATKPQIFTHYELGITTFTTSLASSEQTYGIFLDYKGLESGLAYFNTDNDRTLFFQIGFIL